MAVELVQGYGWVLMVLIANLLVTNVWMMYKVVVARLEYKVNYPIMYAVESDSKDFKTFNCVQRAHQNTLEFMPAFVTSLLLGGLQYPLPAAAFGALYTLMRIQYFRGYSTGQAAARFSGGARLQWLGLFGLLGCTFALALHQLLPQYV